MTPDADAQRAELLPRSKWDERRALHHVNAESRAARQQQNGGEWMKLAVLLVALLFLLVPATARAECAWVMWVRDFSTLGASAFEPQESYTSKKECERDRSRATENAKKAGRTREFYHCFPDTIDPRGPKGK